VAERGEHGAAALPGGFDPPCSNVTWCPNQFLELVLPHFPRGVVRVVGWLLWQTLAWNDAAGQPVRHCHRLTWDALQRRANVSRGALGATLREAERAQLLRILRDAGAADRAARFELRWADGPYVREPGQFLGFFRGRGHRTYVPNQFFTVVVAHEPLAVVRVVGAVIRHSIGFEAERGYRRTEAALSCRRLAGLTRLSTRHVTAALRRAIAAGYLRKVAAGRFGGIAESARYALRWTDDYGDAGTPRSEKVDSAARRRVGSGRTTATVQEGMQRQFRKVHRPMEEMKPLPNETLRKAVPGKPAPVDEGDAPGSLAAAQRRLRDIGFTERAVEALARYPPERIERQIVWLADRAPSRSPLGMLRRAIEEDWPAPRRRSAAPPSTPLPSQTPPAVPDATRDERARQAYVAWMRGRLEALERHEPERYQAFLAHREALRERLRFLHRDRPGHGILRHWDDEATRLAHLRDFDPGLPDFETWSVRPGGLGTDPSAQANLHEIGPMGTGKTDSGRAIRGV
jgi:hypothetical protein